jgi:uncharacterized phage protein gp47/JayE
MTRYEGNTKDFLLQRMLDNAPSDVDKREGSVTYDMLSPSAIELAQAYIELDNVLAFGFVSDSTPSEYIDLRAGEIGLTRKPSVKATGQVTFSGVNGTFIDVGTRVSTDGASPVYFVTTAAGTIASGTVTVNAEAEVGGISGNAVASSITLVLGNLSGVVTVNNALPFTGGIDTESDASLIERYFEKVQEPATSGNANEYKQWAKSVAGIGDAKVYPLWNGNGTVKVVLLDENKRAPVSGIVTSTNDYIASVRPIGATVTVVGATEVSINVTATLTLASGATLASAKADFEAGLTEYLKTLAFVDPIVRYSKIASVLLDTPAILDYSGLTVNGGTANISIADGSVAIKGSVTLS